MKSFRDSWLVALSCLLGIGAVYGFATGIWQTWSMHTDIDLRERFVEYSWFRDGTYPDGRVERPADGRPVRCTVYPPYALPMFALFFEPGGMTQGRLIVQGLSLASLVAMGWYGRRALAPYGTATAALGTVLGAAIADNATALWVGQFSVICAGLIVGQMACLECGRPVAAGVFWALAMLKPQIALPFAALFLIRGQLTAMITAGTALVVLSGFACWWTEISPLALIDRWGRGMNFRFIEEGNVFGPGAIARLTGIDHRVILAALACGVTAVAIALVAVVRPRGTAAILPMAAACSVLGMVSCYHRHYDNVMLFPALLAMTQTAARTKRPFEVVVAASLLSSLAIPLWLLVWLQHNIVPMVHGAVAVAWLVGGLVPIASLAASRSDT